MIVREEKPADHEQVKRLQLICFPEGGEANLVDRLRTDGDAVFSLVAVKGHEVFGHTMLSRMKAPFKALGLGPVCVNPNHRRQGLAARLIRQGIRQAKYHKWEAVFVLGSPDYYQRFGFSRSHAANFQSPYQGPYLMALPLQDKALPCRAGAIEYAPAFGLLD